MTSKLSIVDTQALNLEHITALAVAECRRQQVGLDRVAYLLEAYCYALENTSRRPSLEDVLTLGSLVEPSYKGEIRRIPVTFASGGTSAAPTAIPSALSNMFEILDGDVDSFEFTRQFLWVHPFIDGNGRTAWVLYNWLTSQLENPVPLPKFF